MVSHYGQSLLLHTGSHTRNWILTSAIWAGLWKHSITFKTSALREWGSVWKSLEIWLQGSDLDPGCSSSTEAWVLPEFRQSKQEPESCRREKNPPHHLCAAWPGSCGVRHKLALSLSPHAFSLPLKIAVGSQSHGGIRAPEPRGTPSWSQGLTPWRALIKGTLWSKWKKELWSHL